MTVIAVETTRRVQLERDRSEARLEQSRLHEELVGNVRRLQQLDRRHAFLLALADGLRTLSVPDAVIDLASATKSRSIREPQLLPAPTRRSMCGPTWPFRWSSRGR